MMDNELVGDLLSIGFELIQIKLALEDGQWLKTAQISQAEAEEAHAVVVALIKEREKEIRKRMH
jgi:hypothetical protein